MPAAPLLSDDELRSALAELAGWELVEGRLVRHVRLPGFVEAVELVRRVAEPAERLNHHPDVEIHWRDLTLSLWTHVSGGITERDVRLAREIDRLLESEAAQRPSR